MLASVVTSTRADRYTSRAPVGIASAESLYVPPRAVVSDPHVLPVPSTIDAPPQLTLVAAIVDAHSIASTTTTSTVNNYNNKYNTTRQRRRKTRTEDKKHKHQQHHPPPPPQDQSRGDKKQEQQTHFLRSESSPPRSLEYPPVASKTLFASMLYSGPPDTLTSRTPVTSPPAPVVRPTRRAPNTIRTDPPPA